jgi:uncharacterized protein DUF1573
MRYVRVFVFVASVCSFVGAAAYVGHYHFFGPGLFQPTILCENPNQNVGKVSDEEPVACLFRVCNRGSRRLLINAVLPSCGSCIEIVSIPMEPILPGEEGVVEASLLTERLKEGPVTKSFAVHSNDPKRPVVIFKIIADIEKSKAEATQEPLERE